MVKIKFIQDASNEVLQVSITSRILNDIKGINAKNPRAMVVKYDPTIQSYFNSSRALQKKFGSLSKKLVLVIENMMKTRRVDMMQMPGNPHPLRKYRDQGIFSITVKHPFRCIFRVEPSGELITILNVVNYHDHQQRVL